MKNEIVVSTEVEITDQEGNSNNENTSVQIKGSGGKIRHL